MGHVDIVEIIDNVVSIYAQQKQLCHSANFICTTALQCRTYEPAPILMTSHFLYINDVYYAAYPI